MTRAETYSYQSWVASNMVRRVLITLRNKLKDVESVHHPSDWHCDSNFGRLSRRHCWRTFKLTIHVLRLNKALVGLGLQSRRSPRISKWCYHYCHAFGSSISDHNRSCHLVQGQSLIDSHWDQQLTCNNSGRMHKEQRASVITVSMLHLRKSSSWALCILPSAMSFRAITLYSY